MTIINKDYQLEELKRILSAYFESTDPHKVIKLQVSLNDHSDELVRTKQINMDACQLSELIGSIKTRARLEQSS